MLTVAVRVHERQLRRLQWFAGQDVAAEVAYVGASVCRDDHVVDVGVRHLRQVGMERQCPIGLTPQDRASTHGNDQQPTVGQPSQTAGTVVEVELHARLLTWDDGAHPLMAEVGVPKPSVVPTWRLTESQAVHEEFKPSDSHRVIRPLAEAAASAGPGQEPSGPRGRTTFPT